MPNKSLQLALIISESSSFNKISSWYDMLYWTYSHSNCFIALRLSEISYTVFASNQCNINITFYVTVFCTSTVKCQEQATILHKIKPSVVKISFNCNTLGLGIRYTHTLKSRIWHYFHATLQLHNVPDDWAWELFKPSKDAASLLVCILFNLKVLGFRFFVGDVISGVGFRYFWPSLPGPDCQHQEPLFWFKFLLQTRL